MYRITLKLYRDCAGTGAAFDPLAKVGVFRASDGTSVTTINMQYKGSSFVPINNPNGCFTIPPNLCLETTTYIDSISLPQIAGGYDIVYQRCCRNPTIVNLIGPGGAGSTYHSYITSQDSTCNSSPYFNNFPPVVLCIDDELQFDHSATDPDGDSLVYEFARPYHGGSTFNPAPNPSPPPFANTNWAGGFSDAYQLASAPALNLNPITGLLTGTPNAVGQYVVCIIVKEYRNGVYLSETRRDFQFNVFNCPKSVSAVAQQTVFCDDYTVSFQNNSNNANNFHWDFGDPLITNDTSNLASPQYLYNDSGTYTITLIAEPNTKCADTSYSTFRVFPKLDPLFTKPFNQCFNGHSFDFSALGSFYSTTDINWDFGVNGVPSNSSSLTPNNITFSTSGKQIITLTYTDFSCTKQFVDSITVYKSPTAIFTIDSSTFCDDETFKFQNNSIDANSYYWDFGDLAINNDTSILASPQYIYNSPGNYTTTLIATTINQCRDTTYNVANAYPRIDPLFIAPPSQCFNGHSFNFSALGAFYNTTDINWNFGVNGIPSNSTLVNPNNINFSSNGEQTITLTYSDFGCIKQFIDTINILTNPVANFTIDSSTFCDDQTFTFQNNSLNASDYYWDFGDLSINNDTSTLNSPQYRYANPGIYKVMLIAEPNFTCPDTSYITFKVNPEIISLFTPPNDQCFNGHSFNFTALGSYYNSTNINWDFGVNGIPSSSTSLNPNNITFSNSGKQIITLTYSDFGCINQFKDSLIVYKNPVANFNADTIENCVNSPFQFFNTSTSDYSLIQFWDFGNAKTSTDKNPINTYQYDGIYTVKLFVQDSVGCRDSIFLNNYTTVNPNPIAGFSPYQNEASIYLPFIDFKDESIDGVSIEFNAGDNSYYYNFGAIKHEYTDTGYYYPSQVITNIYGCTDTAIKKIYIKPELSFFVPNSFTPNNDGVNDIFLPIVNPVKTFQLLIFDRWGKIIFNTNNSKLGWDGKDSKQDVYSYLIKCTDLKNQTHTYIGHVNLLK